jgi:hypothetical protein
MKITFVQEPSDLDTTSSNTTVAGPEDTVLGFGPCLAKVGLGKCTCRGYVGNGTAPCQVFSCGHPFHTHL